MLLLVSGASGAGKSVARLHARHLLGPEFVNHEFFTLVPIPPVTTVAWRQEQLEKVVRLAIELEAEGKHLLFAGDPVPAGEALAVPSADRIDIAVCLLDVSPEAQSERLAQKFDDVPEQRHLHHAFAEWMRRHAVDPGYVPEAVTQDSWPHMRWERWVGRGPGPEWAMPVIDTSEMTPEEMGQAVADWCRAAVAGEAPVFRAGWHLEA
jgi:hypothetical protein